MEKPTWLKKQNISEDFEIVQGYDPYIKGYMDQDPKGYFLIRINKEAKQIEAAHCTKEHIITLMITGETAQEVYMKIVELELVSLLDHAAYLGKELKKAEDALKSEKEYVQDN